MKICVIIMTVDLILYSVSIILYASSWPVLALAKRELEAGNEKWKYYFALFFVCVISSLSLCIFVGMQILYKLVAL